MKLIVAGGRNLQLTAEGFLELEDLHARHRVTVLVTGCATGIDACGERWAKSRGIRIERFPADWKTLKKAAGPIRNRQMAQYAEAVALFKGGKGTRDMAEQADLAGLHVFDFREFDFMVCPLDEKP